ncbi:MAG TPA: roadblock/LC7 domain-containing protein [Verrucomicrobiae bacterium]|nr:roadblock/LC7 domain-containing protein [Verrucomicrobiae bacterium]
MFGALKKLFSKPEKPAHEEPAAPPPPPPPAYVPPPPRPAPASPVAAAPAAPAAEVVAIPLTAVVPKLPGNLTTLVIKAAGATFSLPVKTALDQLPSGRVRIPFGELRQGVPPGTFADNSTHDAAMIELPLPVILAGINPARLTRRPQKRVEVPDEVTGVFGPKGTSQAQVATAPAPAAAPATPAAEPPAPAPVPPPPAPPVAAAPMPPPAPAAPPPAPPKPVAPVRPPISAPKPPASATSPSPLPFAQKSAAPTAAPAPAKLPSMTTKAPPPPAPTAPVIEKTAAPSDVVSVPLSDISETWPDPVRQEIARGEWDLSMVVIPLSRLEQGMKAGRLSFTWGDIRQLLNPPVGSISSPNTEVPVDLPLKVMAPLFLAARRPAAPQKKVQVGENIPDVFAGLKAGAALTAPTAKAPSPVPESEIDLGASAVEEAPAPAPPPPAHAPRPDALGALFGQPLKGDWSPLEITQKISALPGVAGSLITMSDGLLVAGQAPAPQKAETVAAFLPQMFARMGQYAGEMQLGSLTALHLFTADAPCAVFKAGKLYLGVIGRAGEALPEAQLLRIASELAKRNP